MPFRGSRLAKFLRESLMFKRYSNLFWINESERSFALSCIHKNSGEYSPDEERIYVDWVKLKDKNLIHSKKSSDPRQRLRAAMKKKSRFFKFIRKVPQFMIYQFIESIDVSPAEYDTNSSESDNVPSPSPISDINPANFPPVVELDRPQTPENYAFPYYIVDENRPPDTHECVNQLDQLGNSNEMDIDSLSPTLTVLDSQADDFLRNELLDQNDKEFIDTLDLRKLCEEEGINNCFDMQSVQEDAFQVHGAKECATQPQPMVYIPLKIGLSVTGFTRVGDHVILITKILKQETCDQAYPTTDSLNQDMPEGILPQDI